MPNLTVNDFLVDAYQEAYATPEYTTSNLLGLKHFHIITQDLWSEIVHRRKANSNWEIWLTNTLALQNEYTKPTSDSTTVGAAYIESVSVAYNDKTYSETGNMIYIPCSDATDDQIKDWEYYLENQSQQNPIYYERDGSVFIAPEPRTEDIGTNRIKITGIRSIASGSWTTSTTETETKLPISALDCIKLGVIWKIHSWHRRDRAVIIDAKNEYLNAKQDIVNKIHTEKPFINEFPR